MFDASPVPVAHHSVRSYLFARELAAAKGLHPDVAFGAHVRGPQAGIDDFGHGTVAAGLYEQHPDICVFGESAGDNRARRARSTHHEVIAGLQSRDQALLVEPYLDVEFTLGRIAAGRRDAQPSDQVLRGLARALHLGDDATEYMHSLVRPITPRCLSAPLDPAIERLIDLWPNPAYVQSSGMTVLAANTAARSLTPYFSPGVNVLRETFLDPELREGLRNWDSISAVLVKWFRFNTIAVDRDNSELSQLLDEVRVSKRFRTLWAQYEPERKTTGRAFLTHPEVGPIDLVYRALEIPESHHTVVTYLAAPGSESAEKLTAIAS